MSREFSPRLLGVVRDPPPPLPRVVLRVLLVLLALLIVWAFIGRLDIVARADGKLIPQTRLKIVQPMEGGRVSRILVEEGQRVEAGSVLMMMDTRLSDADMEKLEVEVETARIQLARVEAELSGDSFRAPEGTEPELGRQVLEQYRANHREFLSALQEQKALRRQVSEDLAAAEQIESKLSETLPLVREREVALAKLVGEGYSNRLELLEKQRERIDMERDLNAQRHVIQGLRAKLEEADARIDNLEGGYRKRLLDERLTLQKQLDQLEQDQAKQRYRNELMELRAPQDGYVQDIATHTEGSVVPAGTVMMSIVPVDEPLQAEVYVSNTDVGFVDEGQRARVKMAAYEFQRYGMIDAVVEHISADAISSQEGASADRPSQLNYRALLRLDRQHLERDGLQFGLRPGMQVTVEIKTGARSVMDYLLSPVRKTLQEAGQER